MPRLLPAALVLALFFALALCGIGTVPLSHDDEAWLAIPGWSFWETGRFASPAFEGFFGMDRHYYGFFPLYPIAVGGAMHVLGPSLAAARAVSLLFVLGILAATYALGRRLFSEAHALVALGLLVLCPVALPTSSAPGGIPMLDLSRFVRNDVAAAAFGLASLAVALPALARGAASRRRLFAAGLLAGLAVLGHVYALAFAASVLLLLASRRALAAAPALLAGLLVPLVPYALYVVSGFRDFIDQNRNYSRRFAFSPRFFAENLWNERARYRAVTHRLLAGDPAAILFAAALAFGLVVLFRDRGGAGRLLLAPLLTVPLLFALFLAPKNVTYLASVWPLMALAAAAGIVALWRGAAARGRAAICAGLVVLAAEGFLAARALVTKVRETTPYERLARRLLPLFPRESRILAMNSWWFALGPARPGFRSMMIPVFLATPSYTKSPTSFGEAADRLAPDLVLVDSVLDRFMDEAASPAHAFHRTAVEMRAYLDSRCRVAARLEDPTYGVIRIYEVRPRAPAREPSPR